MNNITDTIISREPQNGDYDKHAEFTQTLVDKMRDTPGWVELSSAHRQSLSCISDKIARILCGDANHSDHWHDIQGYAKLAEDRCVDTTQPQLPIPESPPTHTPSIYSWPTDKYKAPALSNKAWIPWVDMYPPAAKRIRVKFRDGGLSPVIEQIAFNDLRWHAIGSGTDIVAILVVEQ